MKTKKKADITLKQKILLVFIGIFLALVFLEVFLRVGGFILSSYQRAHNKEGLDTDYRILCLGESTTALGGKYSWPAQLEVILNNRSSKIKFKVFNEGIPDTNTAFILSRLEQNIKQYKPNITITMMGINDRAMIYNLKDKKIPFLEDFKSYKLIKMLINLFKNKIKGIKEEENNLFEMGVKYYEEGKIKEGEEIFKYVIENNKDIRTDGPYAYLEEIYYKGILSEKDVKKIFNKKGFYLYKESNINTKNITRYNYNLIHQKIEKKGIGHIAMQYPTLNINELKDIFKGNKDIILVSNEGNFKKALLEGGYWDYFTDNFGVSFGHCTPKGNRLIAENVADAILKEFGIEEGK